MRRTYRSKKDTGGVLERRDLMLNLDEKSSTYDAFFIQNIKQTKRELSCVGSSNPHGVASNRVRKRKYVKRIVKDPETPCRESLSRSAYLTPDKSIRVNKPMDPFDMLLNTSNACTVQVVSRKTESVTSKVNEFDKLLQKKEGKTYTRKRTVKPKKVDYSNSESSDSDKENSDEQTNATKNTSDIKAYQLLIEKDTNITPKRINDSINNIVNNLSLLNKLKHKTSFNDSIKKPLNNYKNRLTRNIQSPILQKSPLCSTPFKVKYRGESIYKFSPISVTNDDNSPKYTTITEDNDNSNDSIVFLGNNVTKSFKDSKEKLQMSPEVVASNSLKCDVDNNIMGPEVEVNDKEVFLKNSSKEETVKDELVINETPSVEISSFQTTEIEPLLGFSNNAKEIITADPINLKRISQLDETELSNDITEIETNGNENSQIVEDSQYNFSTEANNVKGHNNTSIESENDEKDSLYNEMVKDELVIDETPSVEIGSFQTTEVEPFLGITNNAKEIITEDLINLQRISELDETELKNDITDIEANDNENSQNVENCQYNFSTEANKVKEDNNTSLESEKDDKDSLYDTCTSEQSTDEEKEVIKEPVVQIQRLNDSLFYKYYSKMNVSTSECDESLKDEEESDGNDSLDELEDNMSQEEEATDDNDVEDVDKDSNVSAEDEMLSQDEEFASFENSNTSNDQISEKSSGTNDDINNYLLQNEACEYIDIVSSNDDDGESDKEEKCVSFVTTRRRNEMTNNSMLSIFNDSFASSSTDCDKTVLSNNRVPDNKIINENEALINVNEYVKSNDEDLETDVGVTETASSKKDDKEDTRISFVTTRNSNISDRKTSIRARKSSIKPRRNTVSNRNSSSARESIRHSPELSRKTCFEKPGIVLQPGKKWERSLSIYRRMTMMTDHFDQSVLEEEPTDKKGRNYRQSVISTMEMQELNGSLHNESINSRRSTFVSKPSRSTIRLVKDPDISRVSLYNTTVFDDLKGFLNEECDDTIIELSKLSINDQSHEVTVIDNFHDTSSRVATARDYVLRRCGQTDAILFDECYPDTVLKNCHKIGEGVYGEVFLWRARDGRARVLKIVPIAGTLKVNGECQKDFHEIISEIVIAMELSALRAPIAEINRHFDEGKDVEALDLHAIENATDIFNEVLAVKCVYGSYPARLLDLWDLYDECKGSDNDNPAILPVDQQFIVLELANAGQDLESYQFNNAEQAYALFLQVAYGLAVGEEAFQFEHRDLHWGNVLIAPTEQKYSTFVLRGRSHRVARCGVAATIIDYSLSRVSLPLAGGECAALYNDLATDDSLFDAVGDYQFEIYRLMRDKLGNDWKNFAPYTNILWLHYIVDKMITALRYKRTNTKIHKNYIEKLKGIKSRILDYGSAALFVLTDNEI